MDYTLQQQLGAHRSVEGQFELALVQGSYGAQATVQKCFPMIPQTTDAATLQWHNIVQNAPKLGAYALREWRDLYERHPIDDPAAISGGNRRMLARRILNALHSDTEERRKAKDKTLKLMLVRNKIMKCILSEIIDHEEDHESFTPQHSRAVARQSLVSSQSEPWRRKLKVYDINGKKWKTLGKILVVLLAHGGSGAIIENMTMTNIISLKMELERHPCYMQWQSLGHIFDRIKQSVLKGTSCPGIDPDDTSLPSDSALLALLRAVGATPRVVLQQALLPQKRRDEHGTEYMIQVNQIGLDSRLRALFMDSDKLQQTLDRLTSRESVRIESFDGIDMYVYQDLATSWSSHSQRKHYLAQALLLTSHIFPRNLRVPPDHRKTRLLTILVDVLRRHVETDLALPSHDAIIRSMLLASRFGSLTGRCQILSLADRLLDHSVIIDLHAEAVYQRSVVLRLKGDASGSTQLLRNFLNNAGSVGLSRSSHIIGLLHLSLSNNHAYRDEWVSAAETIESWRDLACTKMDNLTWSFNLGRARILKGQGKFGDACRIFKSCLKGQCGSKRHLVLSHLSDTCIELHYRMKNNQDTYELLKAVETSISFEIEILRRTKPRSKGFRRLLLSLSEVKIRSDQVAQALPLLLEVCNIYEDLSDHDIVDRLGHLRALIAIARISPPLLEESGWQNALNLGRTYWPQEDEVFIVALIHLFLCTARLRRNDKVGAQTAFDYAVSICRKRGPQFLIPGAGTYMFDDVQRQIESLSGWRIR